VKAKHSVLVKFRLPVDVMDYLDRFGKSTPYSKRIISELRRASDRLSPTDRPYTIVNGVRVYDNG
jgi:hypothetical protein